MAGQALAFGPFRLDAAGTVWRDGRPVPVGRRGVRLLEILVRHRGQVVTKAALIDAAWPDEAVEDSNLSVQIAQLRKRLGGDWIRSVERVGYRLVDDPPSSLGFVPPSLGVRPFRNLGGAPGIAEALTDDVITALSRFGSLRVVLPTAGIRAADYVVEGSVRREEGHLVIAVRLAEQRNGHYRWAERFASGAAHDPVAGRIAALVENQIELAEIAATQRERPRSEDAPDLYRRALWHMRTSLSDDYAAGTALLERALAQDPDNTLYLGLMCEAIGHRISMGWSPLTNADADRMHDYAAHGLRQPGADATSMALFGFGLFKAGDHEAGYGIIRRAAAQNPHSVVAVRLAGQATMNWGGLADAEAYYRQALLLDPEPYAQAPIMAGLARIRMAEGEFDEALLWAGRAYHANRHLGATHWTLMAANALLGRDADSTQFVDRFRADHSGVTIDRIRAGQPPRAPLAATLEGLDRAGLARS